MTSVTPARRGVCSCATTLIVAILVLVLGAAWLPPAHAQDSSGRVQRQQRPPTADPSVTQRIDTLESEASSLRRDLRILGAIVLILLTGGFAIGLITTIRGESRQSQLHHLAIAGESASQARTEEVHAAFLDSSQKTVTLVNETLQLAKEANQRAAEAVKQRAETVRDEIESRARAIVAPLIIKPNPKDIVHDEARLEIGDLAKEIASVEGYLGLESMKLSPTCLFVKGMDAHFRDDARAASRNLLLAGDEATNRELSTVALYWAAYELNNRGEFTRALDVFRKARAAEQDGSPRWYELQRIVLETRFFEIAKLSYESVEPDRRTNMPEIRAIISELAELRRRMPDSIELHEARQNLLQTEGNLWWWLASPPQFPSLDLSNDRRECLRHAQECFSNVSEVDELWPLVGREECALHLTNKANRTEYERIVELAETRLTKRAERRSRVSLDQTTLIAQSRLGSPRNEKRDTNERLRETLRDLESEIWIFSQFVKCNVSRQQFEAESNLFWQRIDSRTWDVA